MHKIANKIFFFSLVSMVSLQIFAQNANCKKDNIFSVRSPISVSKTELGKFDYYYQFKKNADLDAPVIIVIPGGPGGTSIDLLQENPYFDWTQILYGFPQKYNAILTDPRSVGCNSGTASVHEMINRPSSEYSTYKTLFRLEGSGFITSQYDSEGQFAV